jgi:hypothetical protein
LKRHCIGNFKIRRNYGDFLPDFPPVFIMIIISQKIPRFLLKKSQEILAKNPGKKIAEIPVNSMAELNGGTQYQHCSLLFKILIYRCPPKYRLIHSHPSPAPEIIFHIICLFLSSLAPNEHSLTKVIFTKTITIKHIYVKFFKVTNTKYCVC